ncbi:MAG: S41 family peptidase, partial [Eubacteriales bacterium]
YFTADEYAMYMDSSDNAYVGIGVTILQREEMDGFSIETVTAGGPADVAGVQVGDILTHVDGENAIELGLTELVNRVRGEEGTEVALTFIRDDEELELTILRASLAEDVAYYQLLEENIGYIGVSNFDSNCASQTLEAIDQAIADGADSLIFDMRSNPGGMATELVAVLDRLLPEGELFRTVDYAGNETVDMSDEDFLDMPMVVLVDENSYSAAEFFAAAMQEYEAATIVGAKTTGKGNFQVTLPLSDGSAVHLSIGKYYTPNGYSLTETGVTPNVEVVYDYELSEDGELVGYDTQLQAAVDILTDFP